MSKSWLIEKIVGQTTVDEKWSVIDRLRTPYTYFPSEHTSDCWLLIPVLKSIQVIHKDVHSSKIHSEHTNENQQRLWLYLSLSHCRTVNFWVCWTVIALNSPVKWMCSCACTRYTVKYMELTVFRKYNKYWSVIYSQHTFNCHIEIELKRINSWLKLLSYFIIYTPPNIKLWATVKSRGSFRQT